MKRYSCKTVTSSVDNRTTANICITAYIELGIKYFWIASVVVPARKPHFFNVSHCFGFCILVFEMSQPSCLGAVGIDIVAFAARHLMALDTFLSIIVYNNEDHVLKRRKKYLPTRDVHQKPKHDRNMVKYLILLSTWVNGSWRGTNPTESTVSVMLFVQISART